MKDTSRSDQQVSKKLVELLRKLNKIDTLNSYEIAKGLKIHNQIVSKDSKKADYKKLDIWLARELIVSSIETKRTSTVSK